MSSDTTHRSVFNRTGGSRTGSAALGCPDADEMHLLVLGSADLTVDEQAEWRRHLDSCPECRSHLAAHRGLLEARSGDGVPSLSPAFRHDLIQRLAEEGLGRGGDDPRRAASVGWLSWSFWRPWAAWLALGSWGLLALVFAGIASAVASGTSPWSASLVATLSVTALLATAPLVWLWRRERMV